MDATIAHLRYTGLAGLHTVAELIGHAEERLRVNVGLIEENKALKRRVHELEHGRAEEGD